MSKSLVIGTIAAVVGLFAFGGFLLWQSASNQVTHAPATAPSPQPQTEEIDTSDWQTYRNDEYGFELKYPPGWEFEEEEGGNALFGFRLYDIEEDAWQKELHEKCSENPRLLECEGASLAWWTTGIHITLMENKKRLGLNTLADDWEKVGQYTFHDEEYQLGFLEVLQGFARTRLGQDAFLFVSPARDIELLAEDIPSHGNLTHQILSTFRFVDSEILDIRGLREAVAMYGNTGVTSERMDEVKRIVSEGLLSIANTSGFGYAIEHVDEVRDIGDINGDGQNDIFFTAGGAVGACLGGWSYKVLYSPKEEVYFVAKRSFVSGDNPPTETEKVFCPSINKNQVWEGCGEDYTQSICFSRNLQKENNAMFKQYLENSINQQ